MTWLNKYRAIVYWSQIAEAKANNLAKLVQITHCLPFQIINTFTLNFNC